MMKNESQGLGRAYFKYPRLNLGSTVNDTRSVASSSTSLGPSDSVSNISSLPVLSSQKRPQSAITDHFFPWRAVDQRRIDRKIFINFGVVK
jgi:hypothetical protein